MASWWKVKRELARLGRQCADLPERVFGPIARARYEAGRAKTVIATEGARDLGPKLAVFLLYQRGDLPASIIVTCDWLARNGYSVLCVANGGLTQAAKSALLPHIWRLLERPNFGYDFGGYREGILHLEAAQIAPETLLILNDSIWLPTRLESNLLQRLEAVPAPVAGLVLNQRDDTQGGRVAGRYRKAGFLESYCLRLNLHALREDCIASYWKNLKITNSKRLTIQRGEKGFSRYLLDHGIGFDALVTPEAITAHLARLPAQDRRAQLAHAAIPDDAPDLIAQRTAVLAAPMGAQNDRDIGALIDQILGRFAPHSAFVITAHTALAVDMVKKRPDPLCRAARAAYLAALDGAIIAPPAPEVLAEIRGLNGPTAKTRPA